MLEHELSVAIQRERERATRDARLHIREGMRRGPSLLRRLVLAVAQALRDARGSSKSAPVVSPTRGPRVVESATRHAGPPTSRIAPG